jgi:hypothetical protein
VTANCGLDDVCDFDAQRIAAHRSNIGRYKRLLRAELSDLERRFVRHRLAEERAALMCLLGSLRLIEATAPGAPATVAKNFSARGRRPQKGIDDEDSYCRAEGYY